ncbi:MAG: nucleotidyl transferase AbiEii/AbiGii toxin family protein [Chitinophagaceae bacterium]|nr:nucleotidyl transferase AbiEii/AbiGii toxin family protein [Bacteroidota bacterium]MCA6440458.1 nucleotidyl transferase AbiEii/AbiGii toxin family protein [Chitinophagaceae bacterium]MCA6453474.1 nucleotidyl transferase AbiEii/AbiGii toxin family protein [Chitinophagaceae bacterium]MCA6460434.1 nucleotidyl transferase AbiEii/AbiGii toxin family protein [Chitinophagaceae bacterium]MCA6465321.1 nucleotidyl transferase AbiEii/AbiGii toxin family protein [Chitinophagaceae bacterium]
MSDHENITRVKAVYNALGPLAANVVFVGGATLSFYADRRIEARPTDDVDILIELWVRRDFPAIEERLRSLGFKHDMDSKVSCRFYIEGVTLAFHDRIPVDVMATGEDVLGFSNRWYPEGFAHSITHTIDPQHEIQILPAPYFLATKLEAFKSPSREDHLNGITSTDFEDIMFILEYRRSIWEEMQTAEDDLKQYLIEEFRTHLAHPRFEEWVDAHAGSSYPPATYMILNRLKEFVQT